jgi:transposase-like protein
LLNSEASTANLLEQVRWFDGLYCPRCRSESVIKHGRYRQYQPSLCKDCDRTFNPKTGRSTVTSSNGSRTLVGCDSLSFENLWVSR